MWWIVSTVELPLYHRRKWLKYIVYFPIGLLHQIDEANRKKTCCKQKIARQEMVLWLCTTPSGNCSKDKWFLFVFAAFFELSVAVEIEHIANSLRKNGVSLKHCLISKKKNNKLTFYDPFSMESNESVIPFPNDSWFFSCMYETYESFFWCINEIHSYWLHTSDEI